MIIKDSCFHSHLRSEGNHICEGNESGKGSSIVHMYQSKRFPLVQIFGVISGDIPLHSPPNKHIHTCPRSETTEHFLKESETMKRVVTLLSSCEGFFLNKYFSISVLCKPLDRNTWIYFLESWLLR